jgi:hypothetical protein
MRVNVKTGDDLIVIKNAQRRYVTGFDCLGCERARVRVPVALRRLDVFQL